MTLDDLVGTELLECHFGRMWTRLVLSSGAAPPSTYWLDTDNLIADHCVQRYGPDRQEIASKVSLSVFPCLEHRVTEIERVPNGIRIGFDRGRSLFVCYDGETIDTLLKLTAAATGEWLVV
jgi:hypothetical protein